MIKKVLIGLGIFFLLLATAAITLALVYEDQVKKIIISQINKQLISPVEVGEIQFSLIKNFPKASLSFYQVKANSVYQGNDLQHCPKHLLTAEEISLQFNLRDIFKGNYTINKITLNGIVLNLFIDKNKIDNYHCWRADTASSKAQVKFMMDQIFVKKFDARYTDLNTDQLLAFLFNSAKLQGEIVDENFAFVLNSDFKIKQLQINKNQFLTNKQVKLNIGVLRKNKVTSFKDANVEIEQLKLLLTGAFGAEEIRFNAKGKDLDIQSFLSLLPSNISSKFKDYNSEGIFALNLSMNGNPKQPQIKVNFEIAKARLGQKSSNVALNQLNFKGYFSNGRTQNLQSSGLYIQSFNAKLNNSPIEGKFSVVDFGNPFIDGNIQAIVKLEELKELLQLDTFNILQGEANLALNVAFPWSQIKEKQINQVKRGQIAGTLLLKACKFQFKNDVMLYENIDADLYANDNYILLKQLSLLHGKSKIEIEGELSNYQTLISYNNEKAILKAYLNASNFELEDWLPNHQQKASTAKKGEGIYLNNIDLKLRTKIDRFKFDQFIASQLSSNIYFKENQFRFDSLLFSCMDGKANANGAINLQQHGGFDLICNAKLSKINIHKLFEQLNNFGQQTLTDKNLEGKLSAEVSYKSSWSNLNNIIPESIIAETSVLISNGELNNFTPLNKLSKFVAVSELSHIKFNELANNISINNKKIYIPQFQIKSSAMNLYCSGTHDFENNIDYHFKVTLSELLSKKRKREVPKNNEFDEIEDDEEGKTTLFISMTGNMENPKIKFDKKELKQFVKDELKNEKQTVKQLLKEEFGLFKKDKSVKDKVEKKAVKQKEFDVEWEENDKPSKNAKQAEKNTNKKSNNFFGGDAKPEKSKEKSKDKKEENSDDYL